MRHRCRGGRQMRVDVAGLCAALGVRERTLWGAIADVGRIVARCRVWSYQRGCWETLLGLRLALPLAANGASRHRHSSGADPAGECAVAAAHRLRGAAPAGECRSVDEGGTPCSMAPAGRAPAVPVRMAWAAARRLIRTLPPLAGSPALAAHWLHRHGATDTARRALERGMLQALADAEDSHRWRGGVLVRPVAPADWLRACAHADRILGHRSAPVARSRPVAAPGAAAAVADEAWRPAVLPPLTYIPAPGSFRAAILTPL